MVVQEGNFICLLNTGKNMCTTCVEGGGCQLLFLPILAHFNGKTQFCFDF